MSHVRTAMGTMSFDTPVQNRSWRALKKQMKNLKLTETEARKYMNVQAQLKRARKAVHW